MNYKQGISRDQISFLSIESLIAADNPVRVIDLYVEQLDLELIGFSKTKLSKEGRPPYKAKDLLKLYYYGYLNRIRSSRKLQAECLRNVEVWWLLNQLTPAYHTIADFRKDNPEALKEALKMFIAFLKEEGLLGGALAGVDGTKIRAQNNKKNNFNEAKLKKRLEYIQSKAEEYIRELDACDIQEDKNDAELKKKNVTKKLEELKKRKKSYTDLQEKLSKSNEKQISLADADSRSLPLKDGLTDVCYNIEVVADSKHSLIVALETINTNDQRQLYPMTAAAMKALEVQEITILADKGFHTGKDLRECKENQITTIVAYPEGSNKNIDPAYYTACFVYDKEQDFYTCPKGSTLTTNGTIYEKSREGRATYLVKKYATDQCLTCAAKHLCTKAKRREIERSEYQDVVDQNNKRVDENRELYKKRQQLIEHPFGTIKRSWGYTYTLLKGIKKVNGEMSLIFTMYNIRRAMSILGVRELISRLKQWKPAYEPIKSGIFRPLFHYRPIKYAMAA